MNSMSIQYQHPLCERHFIEQFNRMSSIFVIRTLCENISSVMLHKPVIYPYLIQNGADQSKAKGGENEMR